MTTALQLEGLVTKKPRVSKYTIKPQAVNNCTFYYARQRFSTSFFSQHHRHQALQPTELTQRLATLAFSSKPMVFSAFSTVISWMMTRKLTFTCPITLDWQVWNHFKKIEIVVTFFLVHFQEFVIIPMNHSSRFHSKDSCCQCISKGHRVSSN